MQYSLKTKSILVCEQYLAQHPKAKCLPLIYPCVIYNGTKAYNVPRNIWDLFSNKTLARTIWTDNDYQLINVHEIADAELKKHVWSGILMFFMKHN